MFSLNSSRYGKLASQIGTLVVQDLVAASGNRLVDGSALRPPPAGGDRDRRVLRARRRSRDRAARARTRIRDARARRHPGARRPRPRRPRPARPGARQYRDQDRPPPGGPGLGRTRSPRSRAPRWCGTTTRQIGGPLIGGYGTPARHAPAGRAVRHPPERDQGAPDRRGCGDLEAPRNPAADGAGRPAAATPAPTAPAAARPRRPLTAGLGGDRYTDEPERRVPDRLEAVELVAGDVDHVPHADLVYPSPSVTRARPATIITPWS